MRCSLGKESKPILLGILYRQPDKSDFVEHINNVFTETGVLDKQECYLLGDLNINLILDKKEIFCNKSYISNSQNTDTQMSMAPKLIL